MYRNKKTKLYETKRKYDGHFVKFYGHSEREVYQKIDSYENEHKDLCSFDKTADLWYSSACAHLADGSVRSYVPALDRAKQHFKSVKVNKITPLMVQQFLQQISKQYAYKTVRNQKTVLSQIFNYAIVDMNIAMQNPCDRVKITDKSKQSTREALTPQERHEIEATKQDEFQLAYLILYTGCRLGEALALRYSDITKDKVMIRRAVHFKGNQPVIGVTKTPASIRAVPLLPPLADRLNCLEHHPDDFIIGGAKPITQSALTRRWEKWCKEHSIDIDRHQIRHEYATMLYEAGIDVKTAMRYLGHTNISMTMDVYTHISERHMEEQQNKLISYINKKSPA